VSGLASRIEITKLAAELRVEEQELDFLEASAPEELRTFREVVSRALFSRHEPRLKRLAAVSQKLPATATAKISKLAMGPVLSGRIASVMPPAESAKLAGHLDREFMAQLAVAMDPARVAGIVAELDDVLVVDVGRRLLAAGDLLTLARFTAVVSPEVAQAVIEEATGEQLVRLALYLEDDEALDRMVGDLPEDRAAGMAAAAKEDDEVHALLLDRLGTGSRARLS